MNTSSLTTMYLLAVAFVLAVYFSTLIIVAFLSRCYQDYRTMVETRRLRRSIPVPPFPSTPDYQDHDLITFDWHGHWPVPRVNLLPATENKIS